MKILILGATGLVGKNLLEHPAMARYTLLTPSSFELNLLQHDMLVSYMGKHCPDMIIHCAGKVGGIHANMCNQYDFFANNMLMGLNLIRAAHETGIKRLLNLSSSCVYPKDYANPLKEKYMLHAPLEPTNEGYALAKLGVQKMCEYVSTQYPEFEYKTLIPCNLYGRHDSFSEERSHMVAAAIRKVYHAKEIGSDTVEIWGDGTVRREFMYAGDLADCLARAVDSFSILPQNMNVGLGHDYTINEYYNVIKDVVGFSGSFKRDLTKPVGMKQKLLDTTLQEQWGWQPITSLKEGIIKSVDFYKQSRGQQCATS